MAPSSGSSNAPADDIEWMGDAAKPQDVRLRAALLDARRRLTALENKPGAETLIVAAAAKCLARAVGEAKRNAHYAAWDCLHQFNDELLTAMSDDERHAHWCTLRVEAQDKLRGSWRADAAGLLIKQVAEGAPAPLPIVRELQKHVVTAAQNMQHKLVLFERTLPYLSGVLLLVVLGTLGAASVALVTGSLMPARWAQALLVGMAAGALGGLLSMAFSLGQADPTVKIPDMRLSRMVTLIRPVLGAAVAIPVLVFVESDFAKIQGLEKPLSLFVFCFLAGFSERWFLGLMERFESGKK